MTGRGIDQILPQPCPPQLYERYLKSATDYLRLAERASGRIPTPVTPEYIWGVALEELKRSRTDVRIVNLETSITRSEDHLPKGINYRMSPENAECLRAAGIDCCVLANNHVLDWGESGLLDTLSTLDRFHIKSAGAGRNSLEAAAPAIFELSGKARVIVFAIASVTSGTPLSWAARQEAAGVNVVTELTDKVVTRIAENLAKIRRPGDVAVVSVHWGSNWGYEITSEQRRFAHALIEQADVSIIHGHSSHHAKAMEVYKERLILYGCGDFINDYEGIRGFDEFRDDLVLMYFVDVDPADGDLVAVEMVPLQIRQFQLIPPSSSDVDWLIRTLDRECQRFGARVGAESATRLMLSWPRSRPGSVPPPPP
jgi:poly-gamma-glutamate synthesis protein (capsule biosynthesis protein)